jgi:hypothetical protein
MGGIDDQRVKLTGLGRQACKYLVEHTHPVSADGAVIGGLGRSLLYRRIGLPQTVTDHEDDTADDTSVINPRHTMRQVKTRFNPAHLRLRQLDQITHNSASSRRH